MNVSHYTVPELLKILDINDEEDFTKENIIAQTEMYAAKFKNDNKIDEYLYDSISNDAREKKLIDIGNEYLILPGGIGTTFEFVFAMFKNNVHDFNENIFILNVNNFYDIFLQYLNLLDSQKLIKGGIKSLNIYVSSDPIDIANKINNNYRIN